MTTETDEALDALRYYDNARVLNDAAARGLTEAQTRYLDGVTSHFESRAKLITKIRRVATYVCILGFGWSVFGWVTIH